MPPLWQNSVIEESNAIWTLQDLLRRQLAWIESFRRKLKVANPFDEDDPDLGHVQKILENAKGLAERRELMALSEGQVERLLRYESLADIQKTWSRVIDPAISEVLHTVRDILSNTKSTDRNNLAAIVRKARNHAGEKFEDIEIQINLLLDQIDQHIDSLLYPFKAQRATLSILLDEILKQSDLPAIDRYAISSSLQSLREEAPLDQEFLERLKPLWQGVGVNAFYDLLKKLLSIYPGG